MEEKQTLLSKLKNKLNTKVFKKIAGLTLAATMLITPLSACQCGTTTDPVDPKPGPHVIIDDDDQTFSMFTPMLAGLLKDAEYKEYGEKLTHMKPLPYTFLAQQGHDVAKLKTGELFGRTITFIKDSEPNNLYMATYVQNPGNYYSEYMLRYTLTDDEIADYVFLYNVPGDQGHYAIQMCYMNDQISKVKTPTIISSTKMDRQAHNNLVDRSIVGNYFVNLIKKEKNEYYDLILKAIHPTEEKYDLELIDFYFLSVPPTSLPLLESGYIVDAEFTLLQDITCSGDICLTPNTPTAIRTTDEQKENFNNSKETILVFSYGKGDGIEFMNLNEDYVKSHYIELTK